ncbi:hypothetical protein IQ272_15180 [Chroococcidiopsidales cyanobacterium LEGE 13417]|nr:hypothetical protein [Chroococcidiopsidales cyanobacterium LEGE 13417]
MIRQVAAVAAIAIALGSSNAIAQVEQQYVEVGEGASGMPVYLDKASVRGTNFRLIQQFGEGVAITDVAAYCPQKRLFTERVGVYSSRGEVITEHAERREGKFIPGSPPVNAMNIVCRGSR